MIERLSNNWRRLYDWTLELAAHKRAGTALFALAFVESSFFPIPPDILLIALVIATPHAWARLAGITIAGSLVGGAFGYLIGAVFFSVIGEPIIAFYHAEEIVANIGVRYNEFAFLTIFAAAFTPIPYKVVTISAGFFNVNFFVFILASAIGRSLRFLVISALLRLFGEQIKAFIDRYFNILSVAFLVIFIGGFIAVKYLF